MSLRHALAFAALAFGGTALGEDPNLITAVDVKDEGASVVLSVKGSRPPNFTTFSMADPPRFVIDMSEARFQGVPEDLPFDDALIRVVKNLTYGSDATSIARIMVAFTVDVDPPEVQAQGTTLVVRILKPAGVAGVAVATRTDVGAAAQGAGQVKAEAQAAPQAAAQAAAAAPPTVTLDALGAALDAELKAGDEARRTAGRKAQEESERLEALAAAKADAERVKREEAAEAKRQREASIAAAMAVAAQKKQEEVARRAEAKRQREEAVAAAKAEAARKKQEEAERRAEAKRQRDEERLALVAAARLAKEQEAGPKAQLREIGFRQMPGVSRVFVRTSAAPRFNIQDVGENVIRVELENTRLARRNDARFLDTSFFPSAVALITPSRRGSSYVVDIQLKEKVPYQQRIEGDMLAIDFERPVGGAAASAPSGSPLPDAEPVDR